MPMKPGEWGYTNPIIAPLYPKPPIYWVGARVLLVLYEADIDAIKSIVPEPLEVTSNKVVAWISDLPMGTQGPGQEACIYVTVRYRDYVGTYEPFLYVGHEVPLAGGREIWGFCKKLANISLTFDKEIVLGEVERRGMKIMRLQTTIDEPASLSELPLGPVFSLKYIPGAAEDEPPLRQLVFARAELKARPGEFFKGRGSVNYEITDIDPTYLLSPAKVIAGYYGICDMVLPLGEIVYRYPEG